MVDNNLCESKAGTTEATAASEQDAAVRLAERHYREGRTEQARQICRRVLDATPRHCGALFLLGITSAERGAHTEAEDYFNRALSVRRGAASIHYNLGVTQAAQGKMREAIASYRAALRINPAMTPAKVNLGSLLKECGALEESARWHLAALQDRPDSAIIHNNYGTVLRKLHRYDEAESAFNNALKLDRNDAMTRNNLGLVCKDQLRIDEAIRHFKHAMQLDPRYANPHYNLGNLWFEHGKPETAAACYRNAIKLSPQWAEAHHLLAECRRHETCDSEIKDMEELLQHPGLDQAQKIRLRFALGKSYEDIEDYQQAFNHFAQGCRLKRDMISYDIEADAGRFAAIAKAFGAPLFERHADAGHFDPAPIFIVGMPRSGTTLVEQILASHPRVSAAGELHAVYEVIADTYPGFRSLPELAESLDGETLMRMGTEYVKRLRRHAHETDFVTDKMPHNFINIGMIRLMLPNAKLVHCIRDPVDTCLSCFTKHFINENDHGRIPHKYSYDLTELGQYHRLYQELMDHWNKTLPNTIHNLSYESLVADPETETRRLLEHCHLEWDEACMSFHSTARPIHSTSAIQVKRPIYRGSVQRWKHYEPYLSPLLRALGYDPDG